MGNTGLAVASTRNEGSMRSGVSRLIRSKLYLNAFAGGVQPTVKMSDQAAENVWYGEGVVSLPEASPGGGVIMVAAVKPSDTVVLEPALTEIIPLSCIDSADI